MKFLLYSLFFVLISISATAQSENDSATKWPSNNVFKTNVIGLFSKYTEWSYERVITKAVSAAVTYGNGRSKMITGEDARQNYLDEYGVSYGDTVEQNVNIKRHLGIEGRYYLSFRQTPIPTGFHIGPSLNILGYSETFSFYDGDGKVKYTRENDYNVVSINVSFGPQLLIHRLFAIDAFIAPGIGFVSASEGGLNGTYTRNLSGAGFTIGYGVFCGIAIGK